MDDDLEQFPDTATRRFVRTKARQLAGKYGFRTDEIEDIQQSLILECIERLPHFDPQRGSRARFLRGVANHAIANLIESRRARCRGYWVRHGSLSAVSDSESPNARALVEVISNDAYRTRLGIGSRPFDQTLHFELDIARAIDALPADLGRICRLVMALDGLAQVASAIGVSRATLHRRVLVIRAAFSDTSLPNYFHRAAVPAAGAEREFRYQ
jgi:RNA polymerase sigma factor (sigma-70 family)